MERYVWSALNHLQIGRTAEYFVKMEFTMLGFDVYGAEVDDHGIDLVVRKDTGHYCDVQVKSARGLNYVFFPKDTFAADKSALRANLLAAIALFYDGQPPDLYLIPSTAWRLPDDLLVEHDYIGLKSKPEWGPNLSHRNLPLLERYRFDKVATNL